MVPLLSICIPTYNRARRLRVMLQAVLPQIAEHAGEVELWISDNASTDETQLVVEESRRLGPINYSHSDRNVGAASNVIKCAAELARGEFVWVLGDDDLLRLGALKRVLAKLEEHRELDLIYFNFRFANYPGQWPEEAFGGYEGQFNGVANPELSDRPLRYWFEMIRPSTSICTQLYANIVRSRVWQDYWRGQPLREDFSDVRHTYPHSSMIAEKLLRKRSYYVGDPVLTIFDGGESWSDKRPIILLLRYPELLHLYQKHGLSAQKVRECERMVFSYSEPLLADILRGEVGPQVPSIASYLRSNWRFPEAWRALARASRLTGKPQSFNKLVSVATRLKSVLQ
jgi:glycosyltransferase involved in cell wall biosynthesis